MSLFQFVLVLFLVILSEGATLSMTPATVSMTEETIRTGGASFTLVLLGDEWVPGQAGFMTTGLIANSNDPQGWEARKASITVSTVPTTTVPNTNLVVTIGPDPGYDTSVTETVFIDVPAFMILSGVKPVSSGGLLQFTIAPSPGMLSFELVVDGAVQTPPSVEERLFHTSLSLVLKISLAEGEMWKALQDNSDRLSLLEGLSSTSISPGGWEDRKTSIIPDASSFSVSNGNRDMVLTFKRDTLFSVNSDDTVSASLPGVSYPNTLFLSNLRPLGQPWSFTITPSASSLTLSPSPLNVDEERIRSGGLSFTLSLDNWEAFGSIVVSTFILGLTASGVEPNGFGSVRQTVVESVVVDGTQRGAVVLFSAEPGYDISAVETITIAVSGSNLESGVNALNTVSFDVTPNAGVLSIVTNANNAFSEAEIRSGGQKISLILSGDTWSGTACQQLIAGISATSSVDSNGFNARKTNIIQNTPATCSANGAILVYILSPDALYDIRTTETVQILLPQGATASNVLPIPSKGSFSLTPVAGSVSISSPLSFSEKVFAGGGANIVMNLATGETWVAQRESAIVSAVTSDTMQVAGFNAMKSFLLRAGDIVITPQTVTIPIAATPGYDIAEQENIAISLSGHLFASSVAPPEMLGIVVTPVKGEVSVSPTEFSEEDVRRGGASITLTLGAQERWVRTDAVRRDLVLALRAEGVEVEGFEKHRARIANYEAVTFSLDGLKAIIAFAPATDYDLIVSERITVGVSPTMFESNLQPEFLTSASVLVTASIGVVSLEVAPCFGEADVRSTSVVSISLSLSAGETWVNVADVAAAMTANASQTRGFSARKGVLITADSLAIQSPQVLKITLNRDVEYDVDTTEFISIIIPGSAVSSNLAPKVNGNTGFQSPLGFCISPSAASIETASMVFSEAEIRDGGACLTLTISLGETWLSIDRSQWIDAMREKTAVDPTGWEARKASLVPSTSSIFGQDTILCFASDPIYDITQNETVFIDFPASSVASGVPPMNPYFFTISVVTGDVMLSSSTSFGEGSVRLGGVRLTLLLESDTWTTPPPSQELSAAFSCKEKAGNEAGVNARKEILLGPGSFSVNSQELRVHLLQDALFDIEEMEECAIVLPPAATQSNVAPKGSLVFDISPSVVFNAAGNTTFTDDDIRAGNAVLELTLENDQFAASGSSLFLSKFVSNRSFALEARGFEARKGRILTSQSLQFISDYVVRIKFFADSFFQNCESESVTLEIPASLVQSGRAPSVLPRGQPLSFTILQTRISNVSLVSSVAGATAREVTANETQLRLGLFSFEIVLSAADTWQAGAWPLILADSVGSLNEPRSWNYYRNATLFNTIINGNRLQVLGTPTPEFDVSATEVITLSIPDAAITCGHLPDTERTVQVVVTSTQGVVETECSVSGSGGFVFTDYQVRQGLAVVSLGLVGESWTERFQEYYTVIASAVGSPQQPSVFDQLKARLLITPGSFALDAAKQRLDITFQPVAEFKVGLVEIIDIAFPPSMVSSGVLPEVQGCPLAINIFPAKGKISVSPTYLTDNQIRMGGFEITFLIQEDEWIDDLAVTNNFLAKTTVLDAGNNPNGFSAHRTVIFPSASSILQSPANKNEISVKFAAARGYSIAAEETLQFYFSDVTVGTQPPEGVPAMVEVTFGNFDFRFAGLGSYFTENGQNRTTTTNTIPTISIEVVDSKDNLDTTLNGGFAEITLTPDVIIDGGRVSISNGVAVFDNIRFTNVLDTDLLELTFRLTNPSATPGEVFTKHITAFLSFEITPSAAPFLSSSPFYTFAPTEMQPILVLSPVAQMSVCVPSVELDTTIGSSGIGNSLVWSTNASIISQGRFLALLKGAEREKKVVLEMEVFSYDVVKEVLLMFEVCVEDMVTLLKSCITVSVKNFNLMVVAEGSVVEHSIDADLVLHARPVNISDASCASNAEGSYDNLAKYDFKWSLPDGVSLPSGLVSQATLFVPKATLTERSSYEFRVEGCLNQIPLQCKTTSIVVNTLPAPLSITVGVVAVYFGSPFEGNAIQNTSGTENEVNVAVSVERGGVKVTAYVLEVECVAECSPSSDNPTNQARTEFADSFSIRKADYTPGMQHILRITATSGMSSASTTISIFINEATPTPNLFLRSLSHPGDSVVPSTDRYLLQAVQFPESSPLQFIWNSIPTIDTPTDSLLSIDPGVLSPGAEYRFSVGLFDSEVLVHTIKVGALPLQGRCGYETTSSSSSSSSSSLIIFCEGFQSEGTLTYRFVRILGGGGEVDLSGGYVLSRRLATLLPTNSGLFSAELVSIRIFIKSALGEIFSDLKIPSTPTPSLSALSAYHNGDSNLASALLQFELDSAITVNSSIFASTLSTFIATVEAPGDVEQLAYIYCVVAENVKKLDGSVIEGLAEGVKVYVEKLAGLEGVGDEEKECVVRGVSALVGVARVAGGGGAGRTLRDAVARLLLSTPQLPGASPQVVATEELYSYFATLTPKMSTTLTATPFKGRRRFADAEVSFAVPEGETQVWKNSPLRSLGVKGGAILSYVLLFSAILGDLDYFGAAKGRCYFVLFWGSSEPHHLKSYFLVISKIQKKTPPKTDPPPYWHCYLEC